MMSEITLSILIPAHNEERDLGNAIKTACLAAEKSGVTSEIIVIDDYSTDATIEIVESFSSKNSRVRLVKNSKNLGLGGSYKVGIQEAIGEYLFWLPGDDSHPIEGLMSVLSHIGKADMIIPYPGNPEIRSWGRQLLSQSFTMLVNRLFSLNMPYYNGLVLHRTSILRQIDIGTDSFAFQAEILVRLLKGGCGYITTPYEIRNRNNGASKAFGFSNIVSVCMTLWRLYHEINVRRSVMKLEFQSESNLEMLQPQSSKIE